MEFIESVVETVTVYTMLGCGISTKLFPCLAGIPGRGSIGSGKYFAILYVYQGFSCFTKQRNAYRVHGAGAILVRPTLYKTRGFLCFSRLCSAERYIDTYMFLCNNLITKRWKGVIPMRWIKGGDREPKRCGGFDR